MYSRTGIIGLSQGGMRGEVIPGRQVTRKKYCKLKNIPSVSA